MLLLLLPLLAATVFASLIATSVGMRSWNEDDAASQSGVVFASLRLTLCGATRAGQQASVPLALAVAEDVAQEGVTAEGKLSSPLACGQSCTMRGALRHDSLEHEAESLAFGCSKVNCSAVGVDEGALLWVSASLQQAGLGNLQLRCHRHAKTVVLDTFKWTTLPTKELRDWQGQQETNLITAYNALHYGRVYLKSQEADSTMASESASESLKTFLNSFHTVSEATGGFRTAEVTIEWLCEQLLGGSGGSASGLLQARLQVSALCELHGPEGYSAVGRNILEGEDGCNADDGRLCKAVALARKSRKAEIDLVYGNLTKKKDPVGLAEKLDLDRLTALRTAPSTSADEQPRRPLRILVSGAGPVGLLTAILARLAGAVADAPVSVVVLEKRHDLATRTNVLKMYSLALQLLRRAGVLAAMPQGAENNFLELPISFLQRALWKVARMLGVTVRRGKELLAYCPPLQSATSWFAVAKDHPRFAHIDSCSTSAWAGGLLSRACNIPAKKLMIERLCSEGVSGSAGDIFMFDVLVAAEGAVSVSRDQARHLEGESLFGSQLEVAPLVRRPSDAFGLTINYKVPSGDSQCKAAFNSSDQLEKPKPGERYFFKAGSPEWCYQARVFFNISNSDQQQVKQLQTDPVSWAKNHLEEKAGSFLFDVRHKPDMAFFRMGFQGIEDGRLAYVQTAADGGPSMLLLLAGDAYITGFFPLGNGVNLGVLRAAAVQHAKGLGELAASLQPDSSGLETRVAEEWARDWNRAMGQFKESTGIGNSSEWLDINEGVLQKLKDRHPDSAAGEPFSKYKEKVLGPAANLKGYVTKVLRELF